METKTEFKFKDVFWTYTGAFMLSVIMIVLIHETGHYLAFRWRGYDATIRINPFMGVTSSQQNVQTQDFPYIVLGGPVFDLIIASFFAVLLRAKRNPYWIPMKMYAATAFLIEGMVLITGLFFQETVTDFSWLISKGLSPIFVGGLGIFLILIAGLLTYSVWEMIGVTATTNRWKVLLLNSSLFLYVLTGFMIGRAIALIAPSFVLRFLLIAMLFHWGYLALRVVLNPLIMSLIQRHQAEPPALVSAKLSRLSMALGGVSWVLSFLVLN